eukprot:CAMPEP_0203807852 /NCGR_PEP_ID=MMETSP0115-20131106/1288_1 /ASSEMBLY_ACC=CAM_ASM_000227 /TAXON_ID=33651 /ORGANISM="Bicosoecid sp, Strain ms1" /LENGTH=155 /DNA_ID=CAMNT_0050716537 /DNA_START=325 /DNA_END=793 /DNA_ORIENTATION=-
MRRSSMFKVAAAVAAVAIVAGLGAAQATFLSRAQEAVDERAAVVPAGNLTSPDIHFKCDACKVALTVAGNSLFNTYACKDGIETAVKLVCKFTGEFSTACKALVGVVCDIATTSTAARGRAGWTASATHTGTADPTTTSRRLARQGQMCCVAAAG